MSDAKVLINFSSSVYTDLEVGNKSDDIIEMMTSNPNFQIPLPELDAVRVANTTYQTSLINLKNGTKEDTAIKKPKSSCIRKNT